MNSAEFQQHIVLHDSPGAYAEARLDEECVDITDAYHDMTIGVDAAGREIIGDLTSTVRLNAADMDMLTRAWLRYRVGASDEEGESET